MPLVGQMPCCSSRVMSLWRLSCFGFEHLTSSAKIEGLYQPIEWVGAAKICGF